MTTQVTPPPNLHVEVFDEMGGRLLGRAMLVFEPAPLEGVAKRASLHPDRGLGFDSGSHYLRLPSADGWQVELHPTDQPGAYAVLAAITPTPVRVGGE